MNTANPTTTTAKRKALLNSRTLAYTESLKLANALLKCWLLLAVVVAAVLLVLAPATPASIISILAGYLLVFVPAFLFLCKKQQDAKDNIASEREQYTLRIGAYTD